MYSSGCEGFGGCGRAVDIRNGDTGEQFCFFFVRGEDGDLAEKAVGQWAGGGWVEEDGFVLFCCRVDEGYNGFEGDLELDEDDGRGFDGFAGGGYVTRAEIGVGAGSYDDAVLAFFVDGDECYARGGFRVCEDLTGIDVFFYQLVFCLGPEDICT